MAYPNFGGAYSYTGRLMVLSSNPNPANDRLYPLEDDDVAALLRSGYGPKGHCAH